MEETDEQENVEEVLSLYLKKQEPIRKEREGSLKVDWIY